MQIHLTKNKNFVTDFLRNCLKKWFPLFFKWFFSTLKHFMKAWRRPRSSCLQMFFKIEVLKNFAKFTVKHLCWSLILVKLQAWRSSILNFYSAWNHQKTYGKKQEVFLKRSVPFLLADVNILIDFLVLEEQLKLEG